MVPFDVFFANLPYLLRGALVTLQIGAIGVVGGTLAGFALGVAGAMAGRAVRALVAVYVFIVRGVPILVWMFMGYFGLPLLGARLGGFLAVNIVLVAYTAAFVCEIVRGAILAVPRGQIEAARSLGMTGGGILRLVILPQAVRESLPPLVNNSVMIVKQSAYVSIVGVWELSYAAREVVERTMAPFSIFIGVMFLYFLICYPIAMSAQCLEKRYARGHAQKE